MPESVWYSGDRGTHIGIDVGADRGDELLDQIVVGQSGVPRNVVDVVDVSRRQQDPKDGTTVISDVEPVSDLCAIAIDGQRLPRQESRDHERDELLGILVGTVGVGASGDDHGHAIGALVRQTQKVCGGLGRRIGAAGVERICLDAEQPDRNISIDFIGGHGHQTAHGMSSDGLQEGDGAEDIGLHGVPCVEDRSVDVRLGGKVHDEIGGIGREHAVERGRVTDIAMHKGIAGCGEPGKVTHIAGIRQGVKVNEGVPDCGRTDLANEF